MKLGLFLHPIFFFFCTLVFSVINLFAFLNLLSSFITLPILFICIYLTIYTTVHRRRLKMRIQSRARFYDEKQFN